MKRPAILQVSAYYPPHLGGQEIAVQELATQLASVGERVQVVTSDLGARRGDVVERGVRVTRLRSWEFGHTAVIWGLLWWLIKNARRDTIVHLHVGQFFTPEIVWIASKIVRFKYVIQMHIDPVRSGPVGRILPLYSKLFLGRELRDAAQVVVLNEVHRRIVAERYSLHENVCVMSNGVGNEFFRAVRQANESPLVELVYVGRLSPQKNLPVLIRALELVQRDVLLHLIGDGECREELERIVSGTSAINVKFHGRLTRNEIRSFYSTCDAFVLPSLYEAQPLALLEAMACRIPVIASDVVGMGAEFGDAAIVVEPTAEGLAAGIDRLAGLSAAAKSDLVDKALRKAETHRWGMLIGSYQRLYESCLK